MAQSERPGMRPRCDALVEAPLRCTRNWFVQLGDTLTLSCYRASAVARDGCTREGHGGDCVGAWQGVHGSVSVGVAVHDTCAAEGHVRV